jgi:chaperonin GroES
MTTQVLPTSDNLFIEKVEDDQKTKTGLVLPDDVAERPTKGKVLAVGEGKTNDDGVLLPMKINVGDIVLFPKYAGNPMKIDGEDRLILSQTEILATLKETE